MSHLGLKSLQSLILCSLTSCVSLCLLISICFKTLFCWELRDALVYGYNDESLGMSLILCPFIRIIVVGFPLWPVICLTTHSGSWYQCQGSYEVGLRSSQSVASHSYNINAPIIPVGISFQASYYYGSQDSLLVKVNDCLSLLIVFITASSTMKARSAPPWFLLVCFTTHFYTAFGSRVLLSDSGGETKAVAASSIVWGSLVNNSRRSSLFLTLGFLYYSLWYL